METGAITSSGGGAVGSAGAFGNLSSEEFIKIMLQELTNQDPFNPQDSGALLEQLSSLRNIESQLNLQTQLESLVLQNQVANAGGMIGKVVSGLDENNRNVSGLVTSVRVVNGRAILELDTGFAVPMTRVTEIAELADA